MRKILGLVLVLILNCAAVAALTPKAAKAKPVSAASTAEEPMVSFKKSDCRKIEGTPNIVICVEGDAGQGELDLNTLRSLKGATKNLITKYRAKHKPTTLGVRKASLSTCGAMPLDTMSPAYMAWMSCTMAESMTAPPPTTPVVADPTYTPPLTPPTQPASSCTYTDWVPSECGGAATFCGANPTDMMCQTLAEPTTPTASTCTYTDWEPSECGGAATYCMANPGDMMCGFEGS